MLRMMLLHGQKHFCLYTSHVCISISAHVACRAHADLLHTGAVVGGPSNLTGTFLGITDTRRIHQLTKPALAEDFWCSRYAHGVLCYQYVRIKPGVLTPRTPAPPASLTTQWARNASAMQGT